MRMPAYAYRRCLLVLALAVLYSATLGVGCGDDGVDDQSIYSGGSTNNGASDAQPDSPDTGGQDVRAPDERCDGLQSGARCDLPHASGVCVDQQCQFLSCESGFRDCDADTDNGCETDITTADQCGVCGVSCTNPESCQRSSAGWVCSVSPVCPDGDFDLDGDLDNGCEWSAEWGDEGIFDPVSIQPHVATELSSGAFAVAGTTLDARLVTSTESPDSSTADPIAFDFDDPTAHAIEELRAPDDTSLVAVAWTDAVTLSAASGSAGDDGVFRYMCEGNPRRFNHVTAGDGASIFAVTSREVLAIDHGAGCAPSPTSAAANRQLCDTASAVFGMSDYVEAYATGVDPVACDACLPDTDLCPEFRPIGLEYLEPSARLVVFTTRGFLILESNDAGFIAGSHLERSDFGQGATRYAAGAAVEANGVVRVFLLTTDGTLRRFAVDESVRPAGPDIQLLIGANDPARLVPGVDGSLLIYDARDAWLVQPLDRSARIEQLSEPDIFLGDERVVFGAGASSDPIDEFSMIYFGVGRYYLRHVRR
jgi:hypothetical protein